MLLSILQPACSLCHGGHQCTSQCPSGAAAGIFSPGCCLLSSTFNLGQSQALRLACLAPTVVSHRGLCLQLTVLNLALTLPVVSGTLGLSLLVQGCPTPDMTCLLYLPFFSAGSGNIYFINICKKLKISLLFYHPIMFIAKQIQHQLLAGMQCLNGTGIN